MGISRFPFAAAVAGTLFLTLSACGGQPITFNGNAPTDISSEASSSDNAGVESSSSSSIIISSSDSLTSSSSSSSTSSLSASSISSSISSSSISSAAVATGRDLFNSTTLGCSTCHGATGDGGTSDTPLIPSEWTKVALASRIKSSMPQQTGIYKGKFCDQACSDKIADYIISGFTATASALPSLFLKQTAASSAPAYSLLTNTESSCGAAYSSTDLRALTRQEYSAAIFQLVGIDLISEFGQTSFDALPADGLSISLDGNALESYGLAANKIVETLTSNNFVGVIDCANLSSDACYNHLIDDFACKAYRRPLNSQERNNYLSLYSAGNNPQDGIKKVVAAVLTSANFLNRSNIGLFPVNSADKAALALTSAASLLENQTLAIYDKTTLAANFSGNDLLQISVKATQNAKGVWPIMRVQLGDSTFVDLQVNQPEASYTFHATGLHGNNNIRIANQQTGAPLEYQTGHTLIISSVKLVLSY